MDDLETSLTNRVAALLDAHRSRELLSTTGVHGTIEELVQRTRGIEQALSEIAAQVEKLTASREA
jgi:uncharacterized metal-binding protein